MNVARSTNRWPEKTLGFSGGWDDGPDPREDGFDWYTDDLEPEDADEDEDLDDEDDGYVLVDID